MTTQDGFATGGNTDSQMWPHGFGTSVLPSQHRYVQMHRDLIGSPCVICQGSPAAPWHAAHPEVSPDPLQERIGKLIEIANTLGWDDAALWIEKKQVTDRADSF